MVSRGVGRTYRPPPRAPSLSRAESRLRLPQTLRAVAPSRRTEVDLRWNWLPRRVAEVAQRRCGPEEVDARLPCTWIALFHGRVHASLAATTGVETAADVAKYLLAGADVVMTASALLRHGPEHATVLIDGLEDWMARKGFAALDELRGMLAVPPTDETLYERTGYVGALREANSGTYGPR